ALEPDALTRQPPPLPRGGEEGRPVPRGRLHRHRRALLLAASQLPGTVVGQQAVAVLAPEPPDPDEPVRGRGREPVQPDLGADHRRFSVNRLIRPWGLPAVHDSPEGELVDRRSEISPGIRQPIPDLSPAPGRLALDPPRGFE